VRAASRTAQGSALLRAAHLVLDRPPWLFEDRFARSLLGPWSRSLLHVPWLLRAAERFVPALAAARAQALARSRCAEDRLRAALARGVTQYVLVSAGLDSFTLRERRPERVFEIDHPATQVAKRMRLERLRAGAARRPVFVPVDLEAEALDAPLVRAGFDTDAPAFFSWLGTTYYLTRASIQRTLDALARVAAPGSELALDYLLPSALVPAAETSQLGSVLRFARRRGEPVQSALAPAELAEALRRSHWEPIEDLSPDAQRRAHPGGGLRVPSWNRIAIARRTGFR
jgi:methyltransferase (TIGR00027 family)